MKRIALLALALGLVTASFPTGSSAGLQVGKDGGVDLAIGAVLQAGFTYHTEDSARVDGFWLKRARLLMNGAIIPDRVKYFVQTEFNQDNFSILDYKASFFYLPKTEIAFGRFLPNYTLYMPYSTAKLEMINYPVTTSGYAVWRQVGVQTTTTTQYVDFNLGLFNGGDVPNNRMDNNDAKDYLLRADVKPPLSAGSARVGGYYWMNNAPAGSAHEEDETLGNTRMGVLATLDYPINKMTLKVRGEVLMATNEMGDPDDPQEQDSQAYFGHVGLQLNDKIEILARYEGLDPNTDGEAKDDSYSRITGGVNYYLDGTRAVLFLNYIQTSYEHEDLDSEGTVQGQVQISF